MSIESELRHAKKAIGFAKSEIHSAIRTSSQPDVLVVGEVYLQYLQEALDSLECARTAINVELQLMYEQEGQSDDESTT